MKSAVIAMLVIFSDLAAAEIANMSAEKLASVATHIVVGELREIYSSVTRTKDWVKTKSVAALSVRQVEKGTGLTRGEVIYAKMWKKGWVGKGRPEPGASGHRPVKKGVLVRAHLVRRDGAFEVLLPNGLQEIKADEVKPTRNAVNVPPQGNWKFVYYVEKSVAVEAGTKRFSITGERLEYLAGGQTRAQTKVQVDTSASPKQLTQTFKDGQVYRSIYKEMGDYLVLCGSRDGSRPSRFSIKGAGSGEFFMLLKKN